MRLLQIAGLCCLLWLALASMAQAARLEDYLIKNQKPHPYVGWTLEQIKADPGYTPWEQRPECTTGGVLAPPSSTRDTSKPGWPSSYNWIGYIELPKNYYNRLAVVVFASNGAGVTMIEDCGGAYFELMPLWFGRTLDYLYDVGYFEGYP